MTARTIQRLGISALIGGILLTLTTAILSVSVHAARMPSHIRSPDAADAVTNTQVVDITFTNAWDSTHPVQRASLALPAPLPSGPMPLMLYVHGSIWCSDKAPHHSAADSDSLGRAVAAHGWLFAAAELHGERPLDDLSWCPNVSVGYRPYGARPAQWDVYYLWQYVRDHYNVDPTRVYLVAHSAGGLTALPVLAKFPDIFAAAVVYWSPTDLATWYDENFAAGDYDRARNIRTEVGGTPEEVPYNYARRSPITFARNLTHVPLALVHGRQDTKVAFHHSQDLYNAIRAVDASAPVFLYPFDGGHGDSSAYPITWTISWLETYTRPLVPDTLDLLVDAGGTPGEPGEPELGPFDHFWWLGWTPWAGASRWTRVTMTHTAAAREVTGVISDTVGITLTVHREALGWEDAVVQGIVAPPAPTPAYTFTVGATETIRLPIPAGPITLSLRAATPQPTPTPTPTPTATPTVGSIRGQVFADENGNGIRDDGEGGVPGAVVALRHADFSLISQVTTDRTGLFHFVGLTPGEYIVQETNPPHYVDTTVNTQMVYVPAGQEVVVLFGDKPPHRAWLPTLNR